MDTGIGTVANMDTGIGTVANGIKLITTEATEYT